MSAFVKGWTAPNAINSGGGSTKRFDNLNSDLTLSVDDMVGAISISATQPINVYMPDGVLLREIRHCNIHNHGLTNLNFLDASSQPLLALTAGQSNLLWAVTPEKSPGTWAAMTNTEGSGKGLEIILNSADGRLTQIAYGSGGIAVIAYENTTTNVLQYLIVAGLNVGRPYATNSPVGLGAAGGKLHGICSFDAAHFALTYYDAGASGNLIIVGIYVDATGQLVTATSTNTGKTPSVQVCGLCALDSTHIAVGYADTGNIPNCFAASMGGTNNCTATVGADAMLDSGSTSLNIRLCKLGVNKFFAANERTSPATVKGSVVTVVGTTCTVQSTSTAVSTLSSMSTTARRTMDVCRVSDDKALLTFVQTGTGVQYGVVVMSTVYALSIGTEVNTGLTPSSNGSAVTFNGTDKAYFASVQGVVPATLKGTSLVMASNVTVFTGSGEYMAIDSVGAGKVVMASGATGGSYFVRTNTYAQGALV
jgi:hypothetical protein